MIIEREHGVAVSFADIPALAGRTIECPPVIVDARLVKLFEEATLIQGIWTTTAGADPYGDDLIEGFHLLGLFDYFVATYVDIDRHEVAGWNYGLDRVRFVSPMRAGQPIACTIAITDVVEKNDGYLLHLDCTLAHPDSERPGVIGRWICYQTTMRRAGAGPDQRTGQ